VTGSRLFSFRAPDSYSFLLTVLYRPARTPNLSKLRFLGPIKIKVPSFGYQLHNSRRRHACYGPHHQPSQFSFRFLQKEKRSTSSHIKYLLLFSHRPLGNQLSASKSCLLAAGTCRCSSTSPICLSPTRWPLLLVASENSHQGHVPVVSVLCGCLLDLWS
jgi:hypothetical protein